MQKGDSVGESEILCIYMDIKAKYIISQMYGGVKVIKVNKWEIENGRRARNGLAKNTGSQKKWICLDSICSRVTA